jgi:predicted RNase H-like HicB family nuclease
MPSYIGLLRKDAGSDFSVDFPDFPGCITAGDTLDAARCRAEEALRFHIEGMREDGDIIPTPSDLETVMRDPDNRDAVAVLVDVPGGPARSVRVNIMLPEDVLQAIDRASANRSRFLADAARAKLREAERA